MRAILAIVAALALSAALGLGVAWFLRPSSQGVIGPGFDTDFVMPVQVYGEDGSVHASQAVPLSAAGKLNRRNTLALAALKAGDLDTAIAELRACLVGDPANLVFRMNLVEAMARQARGLWTQGDRQEAIWRLEDALELCKDVPKKDARRDLVGLLAKWKREFAVEGEFWEDLSAHFELSYDASHQDLLYGYQDVIDRAENAYADLRDFFGFDPVFESGQRIRITLYRRENFQAVTGLASWAGGAFDGSVRLPVSDLKKELHSMDLLLRHELTHAFVAAAPTIGSVPAWLNEGLAQYLSGEGEIVKSRASSVLSDGPVDLATLTKTFSGMSDKEAVARAYTQSFLAVAAISERFGPRTLADLLGDLNELGELGKTATPQERLAAFFEARTGWTLDELIADAVEQL